MSPADPFVLPAQAGLPNKETNPNARAMSDSCLVMVFPSELSTRHRPRQSAYALGVPQWGAARPCSTYGKQASLCRENEPLIQKQRTPARSAAGARRIVMAYVSSGYSVHPAQARLEIHVVLDPGEELLLLGGASAGNECLRILPFGHDDRVLRPDLDTLAGHFVPPSLSRDRVGIQDTQGDVAGEVFERLQPDASELLRPARAAQVGLAVGEQYDRNGFHDQLLRVHHLGHLREERVVVGKRIFLLPREDDPQLRLDLLDGAILERLDREERLRLALVHTSDRSDEHGVRNLHASEPVQVRMDVTGEELDRIVEILAVHEGAADIDPDEENEAAGRGRRAIRAIGDHGYGGRRQRRREEHRDENRKGQDAHVRPPS